MNRVTWGELTIMGLAVTMGAVTGALAGWPLVVFTGVVTLGCLLMALAR